MTKNKKIDNSQVDALFKAFDTAPTEIKQGGKPVPLKKIINNFRNIYQPNGKRLDFNKARNIVVEKIGLFSVDTNNRFELPEEVQAQIQRYSRPPKPTYGLVMYNK